MKKHHPGFISSRNGSGKDEKEGKHFLHSEPFLPNPSLRNTKKIAKKFKKLNNIILASFQAETGWDRPKKREKNFLIRNLFSQPVQENSQLNSKKNSKISSWLQLKPKWIGKG